MLEPSTGVISLFVRTSSRGKCEKYEKWKRKFGRSGEKRGDARVFPEEGVESNLVGGAKPCVTGGKSLVDVEFPGEREGAWNQIWTWAGYLDQGAVDEGEETRRFGGWRSEPEWDEGDGERGC